jgi:hypothetical protein
MKIEAGLMGQHLPVYKANFKTYTLSSFQKSSDYYLKVFELK